MWISDFITRTFTPNIENVQKFNLRILVLFGCFIEINCSLMQLDRRRSMWLNTLAFLGKCMRECPKATLIGLVGASPIMNDLEII